jgi:hypothetical protein
MASTKPTPRPSPRRTTPIVVYRSETSGWQMTELPGSIAVDAALQEGYRVATTPQGLRIVDESGSVAMTGDEAVAARVLEIPILRSLDRQRALRSDKGS